MYVVIIQLWPQHSVKHIIVIIIRLVMCYYVFFVGAVNLVIYAAYTF